MLHKQNYHKNKTPNVIRSIQYTAIIAMPSFEWGKQRAFEALYAVRFLTSNRHFSGLLPCSRDCYLPSSSPFPSRASLKYYPPSFGAVKCGQVTEFQPIKGKWRSVGGTSRKALCRELTQLAYSFPSLPHYRMAFQVF